MKPRINIIFHSGLSLKEAFVQPNRSVISIKKGMINSTSIKNLGVEILSVDALAVQPTPEMARPLGAETREALQKEG